MMLKTIKLLSLTILFFIISSSISCLRALADPAENRITSRSFVDNTMKYTLDLELVKIEPMPLRTPGEFGEKQYWLDQGLAAPFPGVLLNPEAVAFILSEYRASYERSLLAVNKQRDLDLSVLNLEVGKLKVEIDATQAKSDITIQGRDEEIKRLQKINKEQMDDSSGLKRKLFLGVGAGVAGLVIGFIAGAYLL